MAVFTEKQVHAEAIVKQECKKFRGTAYFLSTSSKSFLIIFQIMLTICVFLWNWHLAHKRPFFEWHVGFSFPIW